MKNRKIIKFGNTSFVITVPTKWMKANNLQKGDELSFVQTKDSLIYSIQKDKKQQEVTLNIDSLPLKIFNKVLISYYLKNYQYIKIQGTKLIEKLEDIRIFKEKLPSIEIYEIGKNYLILKDMSNPDSLDTEVLIKKIIGIINLLFEEIIDEKRSNFIMQLDSNINKLHFLAFKSINANLKKQEKIQENQHVIYNWRIVTILENIGDILKRVTRYMKAPENESKEAYIKEMTISLQKYFNFVVNLIEKDGELGDNLEEYLNKKQSLLKEIEENRTNFASDNINLYFLITQLMKDIIGNLDELILSVIDINSN